MTDTVGFIRKLPHHLIDAFRSTLEEAKYADIILHVVDASNPQMDKQMYIVYDTLRNLEVEGKRSLRRLIKQTVSGSRNRCMIFARSGLFIFRQNTETV